MRRILSLILTLTFLFSSFALCVSAGSVNYKTRTPIGVTAVVRKTDSVTIDGVISEGEYDRLIIPTDDENTFLNMCYGADDQLVYAEEMRKTIEYYASWSEGKINIAVRNNPPTGIVQTISGPNDWFCENVAYNISSDLSQNGRGPNFYFAVSKRTDTGEYQIGYYGPTQWGNSGTYKPTAGVDFAISYDYDTGWCTLEWSIPFSEICRGGTAHAGDCVYLSIGAEAGTGDGTNQGLQKTYSVSLGDFTYLCAVGGAGNHASFKLDESEVGNGPAIPVDPVDPVPFDPNDGVLDVAFFGDSFTFVPLIYDHFAALCEGKHSVRIYNYTVGASTLNDHYTKWKSLKNAPFYQEEISKWDVVILDESANSVPSVSVLKLLIGLFGTDKEYYSIINQPLMKSEEGITIKNGLRRIVLYENGVPNYKGENSNEKILNYKDEVKKQYGVNAIIWNKPRSYNNFDPDVVLDPNDFLAVDDYHPNVLYGYCSALALYCTMFDEPCVEQNTGILEAGDIPGNTAAEKNEYITVIKNWIQEQLDFQEGKVSPDPKPDIPFVDVPQGAYYESAVAWAVKNNITSGTSKTTFSPADPCTRGQIVTFLWRAAESPKPKNTSCPFGDVTKDKFYYNAVLWAMENGITEGTSKTTFSPSNPCTRAQIVTFLWRAAGSPKPKNTSCPFGDVTKGKFYYDAVLWAVENGITEGTSKTTFSPAKPCTRAQVVTFIYRNRFSGDW